MTTCNFFRLKTQAAIPTARGPEPSAVSVITLNVFQIPHAYTEFIAENGPSGETRRMPASTRPTAANAIRQTSSGVSTAPVVTGTPACQRLMRVVPRWSGFAGVGVIAGLVIVDPGIPSPSRAAAFPTHA